MSVVSLLIDWKCLVQEIRDTGVSGYQYIEVNDDLAANVLYGNNCLIHLASDQIPADSSVSQPHLSASNSEELP